MSKRKPKDLGDAIYKRNLRALEHVAAGLIHWMKEAKPPEWIDEELRTKDGFANLLIRRGYSIPPTLMYPEQDLAGKIAGMIAPLPAGRDDVTVIVGMGLGHLVDAVLKKAKRGHRVVVIEPEAALVERALKLHDWSKAIAARTLWIAPDKPDIAYVLAVIESSRPISVWATLFEPYTFAVIRTYAEVAHFASETVNSLRCNTGTVASSGWKIADNDIASLPWLIRCRGVAELAGIFKGKPAITVCTGPSLQRNIHLLREAQDKAVIIAVGQALRPLLAYDIRPDLACSVDFGETNMGHYRGLLHSAVPIIMLNRSLAKLTRQWRGPMFAVATTSPEGTAQAAMNAKGELSAGGSVAHLAFQAALYMGCNPVIMVGQDLALSGGESHTKQADSGGTVEVVEGEIRWKVRDARSNLVVEREEKGEYSMGPAVQTPGYYGEPVETNLGLMSFIHAFRVMIECTQARVINATEGGASIPGAEPMWLDDVLKEFCGELVDKEPLVALLNEIPDADAQARAAEPLLEADVKRLEKVVSEAKEGLEAIARAEKCVEPDAVDRRRRLEKALLANEHHGMLAQLAAKEVPLMALWLHGAQIRIASREFMQDDMPMANVDPPAPVRGTEDDAREALRRHSQQLRARSMKYLLHPDHADGLKLRLARGRLILEEAIKGAESLLTTYRDSLAMLKRSIEDPAALREGWTDDPPTVEDADAFLAEGNFARPLLEARRIAAGEAPGPPPGDGKQIAPGAVSWPFWAYSLASLGAADSMLAPPPAAWSVIGLPMKEGA